MARHYPSDYYSIASRTDSVEVLTGLRRFARAARTDYYINRDNLLGWALDQFAPNYFQLTWEWFRGQACTRSRILDVGCGSGELLRAMRRQGFYDLTGLDPFVADPTATKGFRILRGELRDLQEKFDFVMLHHSLEHMADPLGALRQIRRLLSSKGSVLVRVPVAGTHAEKRFGLNWIGLDPPRHLFVPSRVGVSKLAERAGFTVAQCWFDTTEWVLLASEAIARGFPVYDREQGKFVVMNHFTSSEIQQARKRAAALNKAEDGDTACFILR